MRKNRLILTNEDKTDTIRELAGAYGLSGKRREISRFDRNTGTLFVGSKVFKIEDIEKARSFFQKSQKKAASFNDAASDLYEIGEIAVEMLMEETVNNGGRLVVKAD